MYLTMYRNDYQAVIEKYCLSAEQLHYMSEPKAAVALVENDANRYAILAFEDKKLVGFLALHKIDSLNPYSDRKNIMLIRNFSTDYRHQGKGYTQEIITLLPNFVKTHFPQIEKLLLWVNEQKLNDYALYKKFGFKDIEIKKHTIEGIFTMLMLHLDQENELKGENNETTAY